PLYDRAFDAFWRGRFGITIPRAQPVELTIVLDTEEESEAGEGEEAPVEAEGPTLGVRWRRQEGVRPQTCAAYTHAQFEESRRLLRFLHAAVVGRGRIEAFALGARLTRIPRELSSRDPDAALTGAARSVPDWSGGTRLGEGLRAFNDQWGVRGMARGSVVVILSDGWDRGDPALLAEQMQRLQRVAYRTVWVS